MTAGADTHDTIHIAPAAHSHISDLEALIVRSARRLSAGFYDDRQIEAAITHVFGVDTDLVDDGTYLVARDGEGRIVGAGGWSRQRTLFGGDRFAARTPGFLDPAVDAAKIRAFFVDPDAARAGIGARLLAACEGAAAAAGFRRTELMATLPGVPFYRRHGYRGGEEVTLTLGDVPVPFLPMSKDLA